MKEAVRRHSYMSLVDPRQAPPIARFVSFEDGDGVFFVALEGDDGTTIAVISGFENRDQAEWHAIWCALRLRREVRLC